MSDSAVAASARGASLLILLQIASRALTFILNQILLRFVTPELLGTAVQLDLYCTTVLYFSRESLRVALQRRVANKDARSGLQAVINLSYLAICAGLPISILLGKLYSVSRGSDALNASSSGLWISPLTIYGVAAMVELLSEPAFVAAQQRLDYKTRASAEATATVIKTVTTAGLVFLQSRQQKGMRLDVFPFAVGQLVWAMSLLSVYIVRTHKTQTNTFSLLPKWISTRCAASPRPCHPVTHTDRYMPNRSSDYILSLFHRPLLRLSITMLVQSGFKYLLTQGDSLLVTTLASLQDQGAYALASNYGGLIARMLFQPIEDASRTLFANLCSPSSDPSTPQPNHTTAKTTLTRILKTYTLLTLPILSLGPSLIPLLLPALLGHRWSSTAQVTAVLQAYTFYIPLLATNGVTEAFVSATASEAQLGTQALAMAANFLFAFAAPAVLLVRTLRWGAVGLVWANALNMVARIAFNLVFVKGYFAGENATTGGGGDAGFRVADCLPGSAAVVAAGCAPVALRASRGFLASYGVLGEIVRIGIVGAGLGLVMYVLILLPMLHVFSGRYAKEIRKRLTDLQAVDREEVPDRAVY